MTKPNILLVDDLDFFLEVEKSYLRQTPAEIHTAKNGAEALDLARRYHPEIIFMDLNMPVMDGAQCCRAIKDDPALQHIPVIMVFAANSERDIQTCLDAGCDGYLTKPVDRKAFLELGHKFLFGIDRRAMRAKCRTSVIVGLRGEATEERCEDISERGLYIKSRRAAKKNDLVQVRFRLPDAQQTLVEGRGRVAWVNQGFPRLNNNLPQGFGVELTEIRKDLSARIKVFVEKNTGRERAAGSGGR